MQFFWHEIFEFWNEIFETFLYTKKHPKNIVFGVLHANLQFLAIIPYR
jgi:hypothetical protein